MMIKKIKSYIPFAVSEAKILMAYRISFFISLFSEFFMVMVTYYLWKAIFKSSTTPTLGGFTINEMTNYVVMSFLTTTSVSLVGTSNIARDITDGSIAITLIKPISYKGTIFARAGGLTLMNAIVMSLPIIVVFSFINFINVPSIYQIVFYIISTIFSFLIMFLFSFCYALLAFYTTYFFGLNMAKEVIIKFFSGAVIPFTFFPEAIEKIFGLLPFASVNYTPVMIYIGKLTGNAMYESILLQVVWIVIFYTLSIVLWNHAIKRLTILGG